MRPIRTFTAALLGLVLAAAVLVPAEATYPGDVGRLAFGLTPPGSSNPDIYSLRPDGTGLRQLTNDPGFDACPAYDVTGRRMAICSGRTGNTEIWTMNADGSHERQLTRRGGTSAAIFPDFSPNGRRVAFMWRAASTDLFDIWTVRTDGRQYQQLTRTPDLDDSYPAYSPSGRTLVFLRSNAGRTNTQVWLMDRHGRHQRQLTFDAALKDQLPDWRPDGRKIAYQAGGDLWLINPDGSGQVNVTNTPGVQEFGAAWSPDGQRIAYLNFGDRRVYTMRPDGTDVRAVGPASGVQFVPAWQPRPPHHDRKH